MSHSRATDSPALHSQQIHSQELVAHALETYAAALDALAPSPQLQARMQAAIASELAGRPRRAQTRRWAGALAATIVLAATATFGVQVLQMRAQLQRQSAAIARDSAARSVQLPQPVIFPGGAVSLWPTQATVFRVRSTLAGMGSEQQYWVDVRMANDGSMRIERIFAADGTELFARP